MDGHSTAEHPALLDLVDPSRWQRLQDHFAAVLGVAIRTVSPSLALAIAPSFPASLETERVVRLLKIGEELPRLIPPAELPRDTASLTTTLGVTFSAVPIRATSDQVVGYFVVGPLIAGPREDEHQFRQRAAAAGWDAQALWPVLLSLRLYTFSGIRSALSLMEEVGTAIIQLAYQARQLALILPTSTKVDQAILSYHTDRILHSLLEAATLATKAEGGSVMTFDAQRHALRIRVAEGLSDAVVASTQVAHGEGIAGLATAHREVLLVDEQTADPRLVNRMQRRELVSSIVAPLIPDAQEEPMGVLNLRTANPQRCFTHEHVEVVRRLLALAGIALGNLRSIVTQARAPSRD